ncbi:MAG TPA: ribonuclease HII [Candidatus Saccharimonadales bacterium]|nr:ribonuclease HII [Candidatus Saccharimonadales bacterium]
MSGVIGVDEVGRGCWAGPLLIVAARATSSKLPAGLKDSKTLSKQQRGRLFEHIKGSCELGEGWVQSEEIDKYGLAQAMRLGVSRALIALRVAFSDEIIMDGKINYCPVEFTRVRVVVKADALHPIVSAASIYAKVLRDEYMGRIAKFYPGYQFEKHVGYGTKLHADMLRRYGVSRIHRRSYKPIKALLV